MPTWLITGANRGLGLEFVTQLSHSASNTILATSRSLSPSTLTDLKALDTNAATLHILECDTSSPPSITSLGEAISTLLSGTSGKIDYLLNNAGVNISSQQTGLTVTAEAIAENMQTNVIGPALIVQVLEKHLGKGGVVMNMTSGLGSMADARNTETKCTAYSISKAGVNMLTLHQASVLGGRGVVVVCVDPGWVKTALGGEGAVMEKEDSIRGMLKVLKGLKAEDSGKFFTYDGREKAW
ncbi:hypothetical protein VE02_00308 [Pseudogymnoascus sp. 03VT05]|nr:hypothetical protein VE02_00308 [Pseudogymnoascus sp. 03VT05]